MSTVSTSPLENVSSCATSALLSKRALAKTVVFGPVELLVPATTAVLPVVLPLLLAAEAVEVGEVKEGEFSIAFYHAK